MKCLILLIALAQIYHAPKECQALADRYGFPTEMMHDEALLAKSMLNQYRFWPGVRQCWRAVEREWRLK